jgi:hypothetical protein
MHDLFYKEIIFHTVSSMISRPAVNHFALKMEPANLPEMLGIWPVTMQYHHKM